MLFLLLISIGLSAPVTNTVKFTGEKNTSYTISLESEQTQSIQNWRFSKGDSHEWAHSNFDDSDWNTVNDKSTNEEMKGQHWLRTPITFTGEKADHEGMSLYLRGLVTAYDVYFDGNLIGSNGEIINPVNDVSGDFSKFIHIPENLATAGEHTLAIRLSNQSFDNSLKHSEVKVGYYSKIKEQLNFAHFRDFFQAGMFFIAAIFSLGLFISGGRKVQYLYFSVICFTFLLESSWISFTRLVTVSSDILHWYDPIISSLSFIELTLLSMFTLYLFNLPNKKIFSVISLLASFITVTYPNDFPISLSYIFTFSLAAYAYYRKEEGSITVLSGLTGLHFATEFIHPEYGYAVGLVVLIFCFVIAINQQISVQTRRSESTRLKSARLELELLKKNIQPHFLLNTLLSIISWIERKPKIAIELIKSLSKEFRTVMNISSKKLISIEEEIELCESHLELMGYRKGSSFNLKMTNIEHNEQIPPMVFHTLIENGLSHSFIAGETGNFELSYNHHENIKHYSLINDGSLIEDVSEMTDKEIETGFGLKYIKSRLEESFPQKWRMSYGVKNEKWQVDIFLYA